MKKLKDHKHIFFSKSKYRSQIVCQNIPYQKISMKIMGYYITVGEFCQLRKSKQLVKWLKS